MQDEIEGPHGCGIYGHRYYGVSRAEVVLALEIEKAHIVNLNKCIHTLEVDGLISDDVYQQSLNKLAEVHTLLSTELLQVLKCGDEINMESR